MNKFNDLNRPVPVVRFEYPDRETALLKTRTVRVVSMDNGFLKGYEIPNFLGRPYTEEERESQDRPDPKFKQFNLRRIASNSIVLVAYSADY